MADTCNDSRNPDEANLYSSPVIGWVLQMEALRARNAEPSALIPGAGAERAETPASQELVESTLHLPPTEQFEFWRSADARFMEHVPLVGQTEHGFRAVARSWRLETLALMTLELDACRYRRTPVHVRRDEIDHWKVSIALEGERLLRTGSTVQRIRPGTTILSSVNQPSDVVATPTRSLHLFIPRDVFPKLTESFDAARLRPLDTPNGRILRDFVTILANQAGALRPSDIPHVAQATRAMLAAVFTSAADHQAEAEPVISAVRLARVRRIIRERLASATLGPTQLCRLAGMSRSQLYRLLEPQGGVAHAIQAERMQAAYKALSDPQDRRTIAQIGDACGLYNASSFARIFRQTYGCTPREMRVSAMLGAPLPDTSKVPRSRAPKTLSDLLRSL